MTVSNDWLYIESHKTWDMHTSQKKNKKSCIKWVLFSWWKLAHREFRLWARPSDAPQLSAARLCRAAQTNANQGALLTGVKSFGSAMTQPGFYFPQIKAPVCAAAEFTAATRLTEASQSCLKIGHVASRASSPPTWLLYQQDEVMITFVNTMLSCGDHSHLSFLLYSKTCSNNELTQKTTTIKCLFEKKKKTFEALPRVCCLILGKTDICNSVMAP